MQIRERIIQLKKSMPEFRSLMYFFLKAHIKIKVPAKILDHLHLSLLINRVLKGEKGIKIGVFQLKMVQILQFLTK